MKEGCLLLTVEEKLALYRARYIDGMSMRDIADQMNMTRQAISAFFHREKHLLPLGDVRRGKKEAHLRAPMPDVEPDAAEAFLELLAKRECTEENLSKIGITAEQAVAIFEYMSSNKYQVPMSHNYPELSRWMRSKGVSRSDMAERVGVSKKYMLEYLEDRRLMREETAIRISEITGIPAERFVTAPWGSGVSMAKTIS